MGEGRISNSVSQSSYQNKPSNNRSNRFARYWKLGIAFGLLVVCVLSPKLLRKWKQHRAYERLTAIEPQAAWPWPKAKHEILASGVEHWFDESSPDGTTLDLLSFDFAANPRLRFELFDSDLDATKRSKSESNRFAYWNTGIGKIASQLNFNHDLIAAWNGGYWGLLNRKPRTADRSFHLSPIVYDGKIYYQGLNRRWTWGAKIKNGRPIFALQHTPKNDALLRDFDFATGTLQALVKDGQPLEIAPCPWFGEKPLPGGLPSTPKQAGPISVLDHMHTSRVGSGWTKAGRLFVLFVKEPDGEAPSRVAVNSRKRGTGGWTLRDHQNFWLAMQKQMGVHDAVGLDGGDVAQALFRNTNGKYTVLVPRIALPENERATKRLESKPTFEASNVKNLHGGALNYFVIRQK